MLTFNFYGINIMLSTIHIFHMITEKCFFEYVAYVWMRNALIWHERTHTTQRMWYRYIICEFECVCVFIIQGIENGSASFLLCIVMCCRYICTQKSSRHFFSTYLRSRWIIQKAFGKSQNTSINIVSVSICVSAAGVIIRIYSIHLKCYRPLPSTDFSP